MTGDKYPWRPGFEGGSDTSKAAAESMQESSATIRERVYRYIKNRGPQGATSEECETALNLRHQTASARIRELAMMLRIIDSVTRRETRSGRLAVVWVTTETDLGKRSEGPLFDSL